MIELPMWVQIVLALGVGIGLGGMGTWVGCAALEKVLRLLRRTLAADLRLQHLKMGYDNAALNYWVRDAFAQKKLAADERRRADQEAYNKKQIATGASNMARREG